MGGCKREREVSGQRPHLTRCEHCPSPRVPLGPLRIPPSAWRRPWGYPSEHPSSPQPMGSEGVGKGGGDSTQPLSAPRTLAWHMDAFLRASAASNLEPAALKALAGRQIGREWGGGRKHERGTRSAEQAPQITGHGDPMGVQHMKQNKTQHVAPAVSNWATAPK